MPETNDTDTEIGKFTSIIELRAFIQSELGRLKEDIDKLFEVTTSHGETLSVQGERSRVSAKNIKDLHDRIITIASSLEKIKPFDESEIKKLINASIDAYEQRVKIDMLNRQLQDIEKPSGALKKLEDRLTDVEQKQKDLGTKSSANESETKELKLKVGIFIAIASVIAMKLLDFGMNLLKNIGK